MNGAQTYTKEEFVDKEIRTWGFDYIEQLFNDGYEVVLTDDGKWAWRKVDWANKSNTARLTSAR